MKVTSKSDVARDGDFSLVAQLWKGDAPVLWPLPNCIIMCVVCIDVMAGGGAHLLYCV